MIKKAIDDLKQGKMVILIDDKDRENEGDLIFPAAFTTPEKIRFMLAHCSGIICVALSKKRAGQLNLPYMVEENNSPYQTPFTVSVEAKKGVTTGVSAEDRSTTIQLLASDQATADDLVRPGHIFPLIAHEHGVLGREGHTEGALDLTRLAGCSSAAVLCELMNADGSMMKAEALKAFAQKHEMTIVTIKELIQFRRQNECPVEKMASTQIVLDKHGPFELTVFKNTMTQEEAVLLSRPFVGRPYVRLHSSCFTGDVLASLHCDCKAQLDYSLNQVAKEGGLLVYLNQEGRGIGLANKIQAYELQKKGWDTVEANVHLGLPIDARCYVFAYHILKKVGVSEINLMTNNPKKYESLKALGMDVNIHSIPSAPNPYNQFYLKTKKEKLNHKLELD